MILYSNLLLNLPTRDRYGASQDRRRGSTIFLYIVDGAFSLAFIASIPIFGSCVAFRLSSFPTPSHKVQVIYHTFPLREFAIWTLHPATISHPTTSTAISTSTPSFSKHTVQASQSHKMGESGLPASQGRTPVTIITGFAGSGKTTLILNLLPQLRAQNPGYKLALIKNEIGDVNVDTQLAAAAEMTGSKELLGDCICCTNVGQIEDALETLRKECKPDRIIIETSGSAEPLKLVLEVNRIGKSTGRYELDGVVSVIDAENWGGYANTSFTAKLQAQQTDVIVINKWEGLSERAYDLFLDRLGDLDVDTPQVKSDKGSISKDLLFGFDSKMAKAWMEGGVGHQHYDGCGHEHEHEHDNDHKSEVECLSVTLTSQTKDAGLDLQRLNNLLKTGPKDEVYRIKAILYSHQTPKPPPGSTGSTGTEITTNGTATGRLRYILNWSFGRWTWSADDVTDFNAPVLRMSIFTAQYESKKWMQRIENGNSIAISEPHAGDGKLEVKRVQ